MTKLVTSITIFLLCARCVFSYKLKLERNNASTFQDFVNKEVVLESNIIYPKPINNELLHTEEGDSKPSTDLKRGDSDDDNHWYNFWKFYDWRLIGNVSRYINTNIGSHGKAYQQRSRKTDQEINNNLMGTYNYYNTRNQLEELQNEDPSGVSEIPISQETGRKDKCYNYNDCQEYLKRSTCVIGPYGSKCECPSDHIIGIRECLPKRNIGESCKLIVQCPETSLCVSGICECNDRFIRKYDQCVRRELGDTCELSYFCPEYSDCINNICTCQDYKINLAGQCKDSLVGYSCKDLRECPKWGLCQNGQCVCRDDYDTRNGICISKFIGSPCEETAKCPLLGVCEGGICVCKSGFVPNGLLCVKKSSGTPGWLWAIIVAAVGVVITCISAGMLIIRRMRNRTITSGLHHNELAVSPAVGASSPEVPPPSYENVCQPPIGNVVLPPSITHASTNISLVMNK